MTDEKRDEMRAQQSLVPHVPTSRGWSLVPASMGEAMEMARMIADSDFAPKDYKGKPANVMIAVQMGLDIGLKPLQALQSIAVINGRPSIYGDAALALVQAQDVLERFVETIEGTGDDMTAVCVAKRKGWPDETRRTFSVKDAKAAGLWGKAGPWSTYPKRMLQFRARGWTLRDCASDVMLGLVLAEEAQDYIETTAVRVEPDPVVVDHLEGLPADLIESINKGFEALNLNAAQQAVKINEFFGGESVDRLAAGKALQDWLKDEYAKRKFGKPRVKAEGNGKTTPQEKSVGSSSTVAAEKPAAEPEKVEPPAVSELF